MMQSPPPAIALERPSYHFDDHRHETTATIRTVRPKRHRAKPGKAIQPRWLTDAEVARLDALIVRTRAVDDHPTWRRATGVRRYIDGETARAIATSLGVARATVTMWLRWYDTGGADELVSRKPPGASPKLTLLQRAQLVALLDAGPEAAGASSHAWTCSSIRLLIWRRFGVHYHDGHMSRLLRQLHRSRVTSMAIATAHDVRLHPAAFRASDVDAAGDEAARRSLASA
jgi:transposase